MQAKLHENPEYGIASVHFAFFVNHTIQTYNLKQLLDYGAGKCRLKGVLEHDIEYFAYEPSNPELANAPSPCEFVTCIDVLEHIEPECLMDVLDDLKRVTANLGLFTIHTGEAMKILPDGRNAHLTQQPFSWWQDKLEQRFKVIKHLEFNNTIVVLVQNKDK